MAGIRISGDPATSLPVLRVPFFEGDHRVANGKMVDTFFAFSHCSKGDQDAMPLFRRRALNRSAYSMVRLSIHALKPSGEEGNFL